MSTSKKKTAVVTGTSSGIGEDLAKFLAKKGWIVFAGVRKPADGEKLRNADANIRPIILDVTKAEDVERAFDEVGAAVGEDGLDALVNNAGLAFLGPAEFIPIADVRKQFDVNVIGVVVVTQAAMPLLRLGKPGRVVNIGSTAGEMNFPYSSMYCATKGAIESWSECFRREVARWGIKVSVIEPGPVKTNFDVTAMALAAELKNKFPPGTRCHDLYGKDIEHLPKAAEPFQNQMAPVSKCTRTIYAALTARNPRNIYYDTWGTWFSVVIVRRLPVWLYDWIVGKIFFAKS